MYVSIYSRIYLVCRMNSFLCHTSVLSLIARHKCYDVYIINVIVHQRELEFWKWNR